MSKSKGQIIGTTQMSVMNHWCEYMRIHQTGLDGREDRAHGRGRQCTGVWEPGDIMGAVEG